MRKAAHIAIVEGSRMLMAVRADGTIGFIGGKQEDGENLTQTLRREFREEMGMHLPSLIQQRMVHCMAMPVSRDLKCTLFTYLYSSGPHIRDIISQFEPNEEICGLIAIDVSKDNQRNIMKMRLANGVKQQLEILFKYFL